jgi:hypothetical protein
MFAPTSGIRCPGSRAHSVFPPSVRVRSPTLAQLRQLGALVFPREPLGATLDQPAPLAVLEVLRDL